MDDPATRPITEILESLDAGDERAWSRLIRVVYDDLHLLAQGRMRRLRPGDTLRTGDLVHESWLKLIGSGGSFTNRRHFFGAASRAMRDVLVDEARRRGRDKRGGDWNRWELGEDIAPLEDRAPDLIALDDALSRLAKDDETGHDVVMLRYFAGLKNPEIAELLEVSLSTVERHWRYARAWLMRELDA